MHIQRDDGLMTHSLTFSKSHFQLLAQNPRLLVHHLRHGSGHVVAGNAACHCGSQGCCGRWASIPRYDVNVSSFHIRRYT